MRLKYQNGFIFEGHTFVVDKPTYEMRKMSSLWKEWHSCRRYMGGGYTCQKKLMKAVIHGGAVFAVRVS